MRRDELRRALGEPPLPDPERNWAAIRARLATGAAAGAAAGASSPRRQASWGIAMAAASAAVLLGIAGGSYWQFAAPSSWNAIGRELSLDSAWTDVRDDSLRVAVGRIGEVTLAPGSRARVQRGRWNEHRLELTQGALRAVIAAPPRLFFVQTPSALATDLGCAYELRVLPDGGTSLHVTAGWVELSRDSARSVVPAGMMATMTPDGRPSVPYDPHLPTEALAALDRLGSAARAESGDVSLLLAALDRLDAQRPANIQRQTSGITLWHLLQRVAPEHRPRVYAALSLRAAAPAGVSREGILALDRQMLDRWRRALHPMWGEDSSRFVALLQRAWLAAMD